MELLHFFQNENHKRRRTIAHLNNQGICTILDFISKYEILILNTRPGALRDDYYFLYDQIPEETKNINSIDNGLNKFIFPKSYNEKTSLYESVFNCLKEIALHYENSEKTGRNDNIRNAEILQMYYGIGCEVHSLDEILPKVDLTSTAGISAVLDKNICVKNLFRGNKENYISIDLDLVKKLESVVELSLYNDKFKELICGDSEYESAKLKLIAKIFDLELIEIGEQVYLTKEKEVRSFRDHHRSLSQIIRTKIFPLTKEQVAELLKKELNNDFEFNNTFFDALISQHQYFESIENGNELRYQCKWEYLSSVDLKAKRIIYESENKQLNRKNILTEYNNRERQLNLTITQDIQLGLNQVNDGFIAQANGVWRYAPEIDPVGSRRSLKSILEEYVILQNGKITFKEAVDYLADNNIIYVNSSIRTTLAELCLIAKYDKELFVMDCYANIYSEIELTPRRQKDVGNRFVNVSVDYLRSIDKNVCEYSTFESKVKEKLNEEGIQIKHKSSFIAYMNKFIDLGVFTDVKDDAKRYIGIDEEELSKHDLTKLGKQTEPAYKTNIRSLAINYLKEKPNFECSLTELRDEFIQFVKEGIKENIFYKVFDDSQYFIKTGESKNRIVRLNPALLPVPKLFTVDVVEPVMDFETLEIPQVVDKTKEQLEAINQIIPYNWNVLKTQMKTELADYGFSSESLELGISKFYQALGGESMGRWEQSILKSINDFWFKSTDFFDRESYIIKLAHGFETYLKSFINVTENTNGIADVVSKFPEMESLRIYKNIYRSLNNSEIDNQKKNFSYILGSTIYLGNKFRHDAKDESLNMGVLKQAKTITDIAALYVYTANILSE